MTCPDCGAHIAEVNRLRAIIADQDQRIVRMLRTRAAFNQQMEDHLDRLRESQDLLARELQAGRP